MNKHTPGPWIIEIDTSEDAEWSRRWPIIRADNYEVVGSEGLYGDFETDMANASLIAAAPELYKLAERIAHLNKDAGEIGAGMLASLVDEANRIIGKVE